MTERTDFFPKEARYWGNREGVWQIITLPDHDPVTHRSIHFGRKIASYENRVLIREEKESLFIYEVSTDLSISTREPTNEESLAFSVACNESLPDKSITKRLAEYIRLSKENH